jgi:hypothetical protein
MLLGRRHVAFGGVQVSRASHDDVLAAGLTLSVRLWNRPQIRQGGR